MSAPIKAADLRPALAAAAAELAQFLLGQPNRNFSTQRELRFGKGGSLAVVIRGPKTGLWRDHATGMGGDMFALIQRERHCTFPEAINFGAEFLGTYTPVICSLTAPVIYDDRQEVEQRKAIARQIWDAASPFFGSPAEAYLRNRLSHLHVAIPPRIDEALKFHPGVQIGSEIYAAMVSAITDIRTDELLGVHLTAISVNGFAIKLEGKTLRRIWGTKKGGAIKLTPDDEVHRSILVGEGIETVLSAMAITDFHGWSLIDAGNLKHFPLLTGIETLAIAVDADEAGRDAANTLTNRWLQGRREIFQVEAAEAGMDLNDVIRSAANDY